jgi:uncharacterized membrane protein
LLALVIVAGIAFSAWGVSELYAPRAAWLQVGAMIGTIMAANVFFNIIPAHWELIRAKEAGRDPDPTPGIEAKRRSVHNNYFTLPVLITMLAGHFAFLTGHEWGWVAMLVLMALGAWIRHFYNLRHGGDTRWWMLAVFAAIIIAMFVWFKPDTEEPVKKAAATASTTKIDGAAVFATAACASCHTLGAADAAGTSAPNLDSARPDAALVVARVTNGQGAMPAYRGKLSDEEIEALAEYVSDAAGRE